MDISRDKQANSPTRKLGYVKERETLRISSDSCIKQRHKDYVKVLYTHNPNIDLLTSMNEHTSLWKYISLTLYYRKSWCFCGVWEMGEETYTEREDFFFPYLLPGARECQRLHPLASSSETPLVGCVSLVRLRFSALCLNLTAWFSSRDISSDKQATSHTGKTWT